MGRVADLRADGAVARFAELAAVLTRCRVPYAVIGGLAVWRFAPERRPADLDVVVAPGRRTRARLPRAFADVMTMWPSSTSPTYIPPGKPLAAGGEMELESALGRLQIVGKSLPPEIDRAEVVRHREWISINGHRVAFCTRTDLCDIKRRTGRASDLEDVERLDSSAARGDGTR